MTGDNSLLTANDKTGYQYQNNGFTDNGSFESKEYEYDHNGNMTYDINKKIIQIEYNYQNLPESIILVNGGNFNQIFYQYDALGNKLCQQTSTNGAIVKTTNYFPTFETENGALKRITTVEGEAVPMKKSSFAYHYFIKDHLGSTRVVLNQNSNIEQQNSYYPFGMLMAGLPSTGYYTPNRYLYNGKELQDDFGLKWYDYGARFYDAQLGRFHTVDPIIEKFYYLTPYNFASNNPVTNIDLWGLQGVNSNAVRAEYMAKHPMVAIQEGFRQMFDAAASLFTVKAGVSIKSTTPIMKAKAGKVGGSVSKVTESKAEIIMDGSNIFDYNGQNTKSVSELNPFKLEISNTTKIVSEVNVTVNVEGVPVNVSNTQENTTTGESTNTTEMSIGVSSNNGDANIYVNTSTTTNTGGTTTSVAAGAKASTTVTKSSNTTTNVGVYVEVQRDIDKKKH